MIEERPKKLRAQIITLFLAMFSAGEAYWGVKEYMRSGDAFSALMPPLFVVACGLAAAAVDYMPQRHEALTANDRNQAEKDRRSDAEKLEEERVRKKLALRGGLETAGFIAAFSLAAAVFGGWVGHKEAQMSARQEQEKPVPQQETGGDKAIKFQTLYIK